MTVEVSGPSGATVPPGLYDTGPRLPFAGTELEQVGTWANQFNTSSIYNNSVYNSTHAINDRCDPGLVDLAAGTFTFHIICVTSSSGGIITVQLDNGAGTFTTLGAVDTYSVSVVYNVLFSLTGLAIATAIQGRRLRLLVASKNASSVDYYGQFQAWRFVRTGA